MVLSAHLGSSLEPPPHHQGWRLRWWWAVGLIGLLLGGMTSSAQVLHLDGVGSYAELPERLGEDATELTIEFRAKWDHFVYFEAPLHFGDDLHAVGFNHNAVEDRTPKAFLMPGIRTAQQLNGGQILHTNEWIHLAATFSSAGFRFYANGVCLGTNTTPLAPGLLHAAPQRWLGRSPWADNGYFRGDLDDVAVWSRVLTPGELADRVHQPLTGHEPGLVAAWTFDAADPTNDRVVWSINEPRRPATLRRQARLTSDPGRLHAPFAAPTRIQGRVVNSDGQPEAARLRLWQGSHLIQEALANDSGAFLFTVIVPPGSYDLEASHRNEGSWSPLTLLPGEVHHPQVTLQPRRSVSGHLLTMLHRAQAGVEIQAWRIVPVAESPSGLVLAARTTTDGEGQFQFINLRPGSYRIQCVRPALPGLSRPLEPAVIDCEVTDPAKTVITNFRLPRLAAPYSWRQYSRADGLPDAEVHAILPAPDGSVWVGTGGGLARLDSNGFTVWTRADGLPSDTVTALGLDRAGTLWVGTSQGLCFGRNGRFEPLRAPSGPETWIVSLAHSSDGTLWVATNLGLAAWNGTAWRWFGPEAGLPDRMVRMVRPLPDGSLLIQTSTQFLVERNDQFQLWPRDQPLPGMPALIPSRVIGLPSENSPMLWASQPSGDAWAVLNNEVCHYQGRWFSLPWDGEAKPLEILALSLDTQGSLWMGTRTQGLWRRQANLADTLTDADGLPGKTVLTSAQTPDGRVWIGCDGGLASTQAGELTVWGEKDGLRGRQVAALHTDRHGVLWAGTEAGIFRFNGSRFTAIRNLQVPRVHGISEAADGQIWLATAGLGVLRGSEAGWSRFGLEHGMGHDFVVDVLPARDGSVWINFDMALIRIRDQAAEVISAAPSRSGFALNVTNLSAYPTGIPTDRAQFLEGSRLAESADGTIWTGSFRHGLLRFRAGQWTCFGTDTGLPSSRVQAVQTAPDGRVWCGTPLGATVYDGELWSTLDVEDGLAGTSVQHLRLDPDGSIWLATSGGLTRYRPGRTPPTLRIQTVQGDPVRSQEEPGPNLAVGERVQFSVQTEGRNRVRWRVSDSSDSGLWSPTSARRDFSFQPIRPGRYTLEVMAVDRDLNRSQPVRLPLTVVWPWFRNPWILTPLTGLGMASFAGVGWLARRSRKSRLEAARLRQEALARTEQDRLGAEFARQLIRTQEAERSRLAHELHDSLGQELLLIRNTALLASQNSPGGPVSDRPGPLIDIAERASRTIEELRNIAYALRPQELDRLGLVRALKVLCEEMAEAGALTLDFAADPLNGSLAPEMEISLYRVVQEALSNVVHHARATAISVRLSTSENRLRITLRDNGVGFDTSGRSSESASLGLVGMAERIRLLGGEFSLTSRPQEGTVIDFWLPIRRPHSTELPPNS